MELQYYSSSFLLATRKAALASSDWIGKGDNKSADKAAVEAMRKVFQFSFGDSAGGVYARIVIGEGERDEAPMLYIGEEFGSGKIGIDIAVDPLEGTNLCANDVENSMSVLAIGSRNSLLNAPDVYMDKIAVGMDENGNLPDINLDYPVEKNLQNLAKFKKCDVGDLKVIILDRDRHKEKITKIRNAGAKVKLIQDGDVGAVIAVVRNCADMYLGEGGAPEGVLAAAAVKSTGGKFQGRLKFGSNEKQKERAVKMGISDFDRLYEADELVKGDTIFIATGVTDGYLFNGVKKIGAKKYKSQSLVLSYLNGKKSSNFIESESDIDD